MMLMPSFSLKCHYFLALQWRFGDWLLDLIRQLEDVGDLHLLALAVQGINVITASSLQLKLQNALRLAMISFRRPPG